MAPKASPTFTGTVSVPGLTSTGNLACGTNTVTCGTLSCTTGTLGGNTIATTNQIPSLTGYATLASPTFTGTVSIPGATVTGALACSTNAITCGNINSSGVATISESGYGTVKLQITNVAGSSGYFPSYMYIGQAVGGYGGGIGGGILTGVGGCISLYSVNGGGYTEILRCCWNTTTLNTSYLWVPILYHVVQSLVVVHSPVVLIPFL